MKHLILLIGFLLIGLCSNAQANEPFTYSSDSIIKNELSNSDRKKIKKDKDTIKKQCVVLDTIIDQLKSHNASVQELIEKLKKKIIIEAKK